jgi:hypothetical protein
MKLSEFEDKLTTVSDDKLRLMLADTRKRGPEVALNLILAEAGRRGMNLEEGSTPPLGAMSSAENDITLDEDMPAMAGSASKGAWLQEEASSGLPVFIKILITVVILGGILAFLFAMLNKG